MMAKFDLSDWANVAEIAAATGVVISLIFVGIELRSNTEATQAATREAINQKDMQFLSLRLDSSVLARAHDKRLKGEELSSLEETQLIQEDYVNFVSFEHTFRQYQKGVITEDEWLRHEKIVRNQIKKYKYSKLMWRYNHGTFTAEFQELVNSFLSE
jgi:hypothetical protein